MHYSRLGFAINYNTTTKSVTAGLCVDDTIENNNTEARYLDAKSARSRCSDRRLGGKTRTFKKIMGRGSNAVRKCTYWTKAATQNTYELKRFVSNGCIQFRTIRVKRRDGTRWHVGLPDEVIAAGNEVEFCKSIRATNSYADVEKLATLCSTRSWASRFATFPSRHRQ
jgi:hypothetical protein